MKAILKWLYSPFFKILYASVNAAFDVLGANNKEFCSGGFWRNNIGTIEEGNSKNQFDLITILYAISFRGRVVNKISYAGSGLYKRLIVCFN